MPLWVREKAKPNQLMKLCRLVKAIQHFEVHRSKGNFLLKVWDSFERQLVGVPRFTLASGVELSNAMLQQRKASAVGGRASSLHEIERLCKQLLDQMHCESVLLLPVNPPAAQGLPPGAQGVSSSPVPTGLLGEGNSTAEGSSNNLKAALVSSVGMPRIVVGSLMARLTADPSSSLWSLEASCPAGLSASLQQHIIVDNILRDKR